MIHKRRQHRSHSNQDHRHHPWVSYAVLFTSLFLCFISITIVAVMVQNRATEASNHEQNQVNTKQPVEEQIGVKRKMIQELLVAFRKNNLQVNLDEKTGDITLDGSILFEKGSSTISDTGKKYVEDFFPTYIGILLSDQFKNEVSAIIIEGHSDSAGSYSYNLHLSQARSSSVVQMILSNKSLVFPQKAELQKLITANGRSFSDPVFIKGTQTIDATKSRRVVFKFRLKDQESTKLLNEMLGKTS